MPGSDGAPAIVGPFPDLLRGRQTFTDVVVTPVESFHDGAMFRGGPIWPNYALQVRARHATGLLPFPRDDRPKGVPAPVAVIERATWCGPVSHHFGHAVADFGMRIARSAHADPAQPLLFSVLPSDGPQPPGFFWQMLDHLRIDPARVVLVREPVLVRRLHVFPQSERRGGFGPSARHLDLMDAVVGRPDPAEVSGEVYVSRSRLRQSRIFLAGEIAGESYIEDLLAARGVRIVHPEDLSLGEQMRIYQRARLLIFSEGSALHGLQLLGRIDAGIVVIARRRWTRLASEALRPRTRSLTYIHALHGMIHGLTPSGRPDSVRGISVLRPDRLLDRLAGVGLDLRGTWHDAAYLQRRDADIAAWRTATLAQAFNPGSAAAIRACMRRLSLGG